MRNTKCSSLAMAALLLPPLVGCMGAKAVDTTQAMNYQTAGEQRPGVIELPGEVFGDPALAGKVFKIETLPGKDVAIHKWHANGQMEWELITKRTAVLDAMWAGANTADAAKFAKDVWSEQHAADVALEIFDRAVALLGKYLPQPAAAATSQPADPKLLDQVKAELLSWLKSELAKKPQP